MTCKECRHCKRCPERSREIPCRDFEIKRELTEKTAHYENKPRKQMVRGAKLNVEKAKEIRRLYAAGNCTQQALAAKYHVSVSTVHCVISGRVWREG